jgi:hypothetical protein
MAVASDTICQPGVWIFHVTRNALVIAFSKRRRCGIFVEKDICLTMSSVGARPFL